MLEIEVAAEFFYLFPAVLPKLDNRSLTSRVLRFVFSMESGSLFVFLRLNNDNDRHLFIQHRRWKGRLRGSDISETK